MSPRHRFHHLHTQPDKGQEVPCGRSQTASHDRKTRLTADQTELEVINASQAAATRVLTGSHSGDTYMSSVKLLNSITAVLSDAKGKRGGNEQVQDEDALLTPLRNAAVIAESPESFGSSQKYKVHKLKLPACVITLAANSGVPSATTHQIMFFSPSQANFIIYQR